MSYKTKDLCKTFGIHPQTVCLWVKEGLAPNSKQKPYLFHWSEVKRFITERQSNRKHKCKSDEFYCMKCRLPQKSWENIVDIYIRNKKLLNIKGICLICNSEMNKAGSVKRILEYLKIYKTQTIHNKDLIDYDISPTTTYKRGEE